MFNFAKFFCDVKLLKLKSEYLAERRRNTLRNNNHLYRCDLKIVISRVCFARSFRSGESRFIFVHTKAKIEFALQLRFQFLARAYRRRLLFPFAASIGFPTV